MRSASLFLLFTVAAVATSPGLAIQDSLYIRKVGATPQTWGRVTEVVVQDSIVVVGTYLHTLEMLSHSSSGEFTEIGHSQESSVAVKLAMSGSFVYAADQGGDLLVFDISDPTAPLKVSEISIDSEASGLAVAGDYLYVTNRAPGLQIIDVSVPMAPYEIGRYEFERATDVDVLDGYAYVATWQSGLRVINVTNPRAPQEVARLESLGYLVNINVTGSRAYAIDWYAQLEIIDISDPSNPSRMFELDYYSLSDIVVVGETAYMVDNGALSVWDASSDTSWTRISNTGTRGSGYSLGVSGNYAYVAEDAYGLQIFEITTPEEPIEAAHFDIPQYGPEVTVSGDYAYVLDEHYGIRVIDCSVLSRPVEVGKLRTNASPVAGEIQENIIYVADNSSNLLTIDVSNPIVPNVVGTYQLPSVISDIVVAGSYAYLVCHDERLRIIDVSDLSAPIEVGTFVFSDNDLGYGVTFAISDNHVYLPTRDSLLILDVSIPNSPVKIGSIYLPRKLGAIAVSEDFAYLAFDEIGLGIYNIENPAVPISVGPPLTQDGWTEISVIYNDFFDISISDEYLYMIESLDALVIVDVSHPGNPVPTGHYRTQGFASSVEVSGRWALVADRMELGVYDCSVAIGDESGRPQQFRLDPVYPNPFNSSTTISFDLPSASVVKLKIFNILGQEIVSLLDSEQPAGVNRIVWDGKNSAGQTVPSGVYLCQIKAANITETKKMVLLR